MSTEIVNREICHHVRDASTMIFVESAQAAPGGALFINTATGGELAHSMAVPQNLSVG
jgi:hypothetical protein